MKNNGKFLQSVSFLALVFALLPLVPLTAYAANSSGLDTPSGVNTLPIAVEGQTAITLNADTSGANPAKPTVVFSGPINEGTVTDVHGNITGYETTINTDGSMIIGSNNNVSPLLTVNGTQNKNTVNINNTISLENVSGSYLGSGGTIIMMDNAPNPVSENLLNPNGLALFSGSSLPSANPTPVNLISSGGGTLQTFIYPGGMTLSNPAGSENIGIAGGTGISINDIDKSGNSTPQAWINNVGAAYFGGFVSVGKQVAFDGLGTDGLTGAITVGNATDGIYLAHNVVSGVGSDAITVGNGTTGIYLNGQGGFTLSSNGANVANINMQGGATFASVYCGQGCPGNSDERLKKNILPLDLKAINTVQKMQPVTFEWKEPKGNIGKGEQIGLIAQDLQKILPQIVVMADDKDKTLSVKYDELIPVLIKAIQEQQTEIRAQHDEIEALKVELDKK